MKAITRAIPDTYVNAIARGAHPPIDVARARAQHAAYIEALEGMGVEGVTLPADPAYPDCCFIEDTAVVLGGVAVIARPAAPSRRGEELATAEALRQMDDVEFIEHTPPGATLDGGDCLRLGTTLYVGLSARTNRPAIAFLAEVLGRHGLTVVAVPVPKDELHLKSIATPLGPDRVLLARDTLDPSVFEDAGVVWVPYEERHGANVLARGEQVLVPRGFMRTCETLERCGFRVSTLDTSEFRKADGALTCLSVWLPRRRPA